MLISVKVVTRAKQERVEQGPDGGFKIWVRAVPERGAANERVLELLAEYLGKRPGSLTIVRGHVSKHKFVEVP